MIPLGFCQCGCGNETPPATRTRRYLGYIKDEPIAYLRGHSARRPLLERFAEKTTPAADLSPNGWAGCVLWTGYCDRGGYGRLWTGETMALAHTVAFESAGGSVPTGLHLDHLCRRPRCVNPNHLEAVTCQENVRRGEGTKLTYAQAVEVRELRRHGIRAVDIAPLYGIAVPTVYGIGNGRSWRDAP